ncbi:MAG: alanine dehydrogenase, partial [Gammaproteobacteria bacterium]|nr:alanine dehydrogenase [Gammaproteobacteria bacterium]
MLIGVPKEIKNHEYRVGMAPASVREAIRHGHQVMVETAAGDGIGVGDDEYAQIGAEIVDSPKEIFARAELVVKVKEPQAAERAL